MIHPSRHTRILALGLTLLLAAATAGCRQNPKDEVRGYRLSGESTTLPADFEQTGWSFAESEHELWLETRPWWGRHSVTLWFSTVDGRIFLATTRRTERPPYWARTLNARARARIGVGGHLYDVEARHIRDAETWKRVMTAFEAKYRDMNYTRYDYPLPEDMSLGSVYELVPHDPR